MIVRFYYPSSAAVAFLFLTCLGSISAFIASQEPCRCARRKCDNMMSCGQTCRPWKRRRRPRESLAMTLQPTPELTGLDVVTLCMDALVGQRTANEALEICFTFSSDRCRAAVGGTLEAFVQYADNPVFGTLVHSDAYEIVSIGPIIPASSHGLGSRRGEMQTVLVEIREGITLKTVLKGVQQDITRRRPTIEERLRKRQVMANEMDNNPLVAQDDGRGGGNGKRRFLWTLQKEIRPPRQNCWLVHEVLFTQNAMHQTY